MADICDTITGMKVWKRGRVKCGMRGAKCEKLVETKMQGFVAGNTCRMSSKLWGAGCVVNYVPVVLFTVGHSDERRNGHVYSVAELHKVK